MDLDRIICNCMGITAAQIIEAVQAGAHTLEEIQAATGACTVCGACAAEIEKLIAQNS